MKRFKDLIIKLQPKLVFTQKVFIVGFYLVTGFIAMIFKRDSIGPIFKGVKYFLEHDSYQQTMRILRADRQFLELIQARYHEFYQVPWLELRALPHGTLGHEFDYLMNKPGAALEPLQPPKGKIDPETDYIRRRVRLIHDIHHVLTGHPNDELGEMGISAFYVAQIRSPLNAMLLAVGLIKCTLQCPTRLPDLMEAIIEGYQMGKNADLVFGQKFEEDWATPVTELRVRYNIIPSVRDIVKVHSEALGAVAGLNITELKTESLAGNETFFVGK